MLTINFQHMGLAKGDKVLDLGCGEGRHVISAYMEFDIQAVGVDLSFDDLKISAERFTQFSEPSNGNKSFSLSASNALSLPFASNSFDAVICSEVLEHIPDYQAVLAEITRVLKPKGVFATSVPRAWPEKICWALSRAYHEVEGGHIRIFNARTLRKNIQQQGYAYYAGHWAHALHVPFWWLKCLFWDKQETSKLIAAYHKLLVWDLMKKPWLTQTIDKLLNPLMGKSVVMYFQKNASVAADNGAAQ
jgi:SAM-dependent methyltransferase